MTRSEGFDITLLRLGMDTQDRRFDPRVVFSVMDSVRSALIPDYITTYGESALELFCFPIILPVLTDAVRDRQYVQLSFQVLGMAGRTGIIQVSLPQEEEDSFIPVPLGMLSVFSGLEAGGAAGKRLYWVEGQRIYFKNNMANIPNMLVKAVPCIYDLIDDDTQIPQPAEFNELLISGTMERLAPQGVSPIADKTIDNRPGA